MVRRPRIKPPVQLPQRSEYDGRAGQSIRSILSEQPSYGFLRFAAGDVGWQYGGHVEEWRKCFSKHLETFITTYGGQSEEVIDGVWKSLPVPTKREGALTGIWKTLALAGINVRRLPHLSKPGADAYQLPFGLLMLAGDSLQVTDAAHEYAHGCLARHGFLPYAIIGPLAQKGSE